MELQESEIVGAQTHIWNHIFSYINSASLKCAVELGIPDVVHKHGQPMTLERLAHALNINKTKVHHLERLMRVLTRSGFFIEAKTTPHSYTLARPSHLLLKDHPLSIAPFLVGSLDTIFTGPWHRVSEWFHNDDPLPYHTAYGRTFWDDASRDPRTNLLFNQAMACDALMFMTLINKYCREVFEGLDSLVDVGGGTGKVAGAIAGEFPNLKCTVFDLPHVVSALDSNGNLNFVAGDMFQAIPPAQAVFLKWILHDWNDEDCVKILKKCKEAIPSREKGGKVIIFDMIMNATQNGDEESIQTQIFMDLQMMVYFGGRERDLKEWEKIFYDAGFTDYKITLLGSRSLIQLFP